MNYKSTGERLEFFDFSDVTVEHLHRYAIASDIVKGKIVLDIASGEGYGSYLLSNYAQSVTGVDIHNDTIEFSNNKYKNNNLTFIQGSTSKIPMLSNSVDVVISFETIEHHDEHDEMMSEIKRVLRPKGILIMSSPDKEYYSDKLNQKNIFHVKELYFKEFKQLIQKYFKNSNFLFQKAYNFNSYISEREFYDISIYSGDNNKLEKTTNEPLYNLAIASDFEFIEIKPSIFNGSNITNLFIQELLKGKLDENTKKIKSTFTFRLGKFFMKPFFLLKKANC
ncbi:MAG: class I SAM-dependent methyltransferase [Lutibacter sp.]